jgi:hypothetical protein
MGSPVALGMGRSTEQSFTYKYSRDTKCHNRSWVWIGALIWSSSGFSNELSGSIKGGKLLAGLVTVSFLQRTQLHGVS